MENLLKQNKLIHQSEIEDFQKEVDARWQELLDLEEITNKT